VEDLRTKNLFKRCVDCAPTTSAGCPTTCPNSQICVLTALTCQECPEYQCQSPNSAGQVKLGPTSEPSPAPQIAGGVAGGLVFIAILVFLIWRFALKKKRRHQSQMWESMDYPMEKPGELGGIPREARSRASTHTTTSRASTVLTRASNVIQIAYIPGVTQRGGQEPPIPPVPIPTNEEQLLFHPTDLRSSAYTDISAFNGPRKSVTPSLARTSIASAVVRDNAVAVMKAKPALVSVSKGSNASSPLSATPPIPQIDLTRFGGGDSSSEASTPTRQLMVKIPSSSDNIKSTGFKHTGLTPIGAGISVKAKALTITKKAKGADRPSTASSAGTATTLTPENDGQAVRTAENSRITSIVESSLNSSPHQRGREFADESSDEEDTAGNTSARRALLRKENVSPFTDAAAVDSEDKSAKSAESSTPRAPASEALELESPTIPSEGPFSDNHAVKE
jgi:protein OPY2